MVQIHTKAKMDLLVRLVPKAIKTYQNFVSSSGSVG